MDRSATDNQILHEAAASPAAITGAEVRPLGETSAVPRTQSSICPECGLSKPAGWWRCSRHHDHVAARGRNIYLTEKLPLEQQVEQDREAREAAMRALFGREWRAGR